ncbi:uncharacterized protein LOC100120291 isoform X2 [Nasonia vitripennis]|nr:uncharacterized protein LOC100120291 isoform X2 [Nasonia vitripennis]
MQEFENKINSKMTMDSDSINTPKKESIQIWLHTVSNENTCSPLTFVMQVPNNIFNLLNKSNPNSQSTNFSHHSSETKLCKPRRHKRLTLLLNKLFKRKKSNSLPTITISTNLLENLELLKIKRDESITNSSHCSNTSNLNYKSILKDEQHSTDKNSLSDNSVHAGMDNKFGDSKNKATVIIPITYNFDEKSSTTITPNLTVQLETNPQLTTCSNCVKITNEIPVSSSILEKEMEIHSKADVQPTDILLETLIKTLLKTTERLEHLETLKTVTENLSKKELKLEKRHCCHKNCKINDNAKSKTSDYLTQYFVNDTRNKTSESRQDKKKKQQIPKRQSSKLSICSSSGSISSDEEPFRNSGILRPQHIQRHKRCQSPSMLNYLVCQSERDIDQK